MTGAVSAGRPRPEIGTRRRVNGELREYRGSVDGWVRIYEEPDDSPPLFAPASALAKEDVPPRQWHVLDLIPAGTVTMLGGDGGTGKSLLALQLAVATAMGRPWMGRNVERPGKAMFLSAEDDRAELHRRLADVCAAEGKSLRDLGDLLIRSLAGQDALLAALDRKTNVLAPTLLYSTLDAALKEHKPTLLVLDTLADLHAGNENERSHARQFIGLLRGYAIRHDCSVLLLAHPSLTGMSSGSGLSGSTAWNGSVRSRLYLERIADDGCEPNPDARRLTSKKANYARTGVEIGLTWKSGVFVADVPDTGLDRMAANAKAQRVFLKLLRKFTEQGRRVNANGGTTYAPRQFLESGEAENLSRKALATAMNALFQAGKITNERAGPPSRQTTYIREVDG